MSTARALRRAEPPRERRRPHLRVVRPEDAPARRSHVAPFTLVIVTTLFAALFGLVVFHTVLLQHQSELDDLDQQVSDEKEQAEQLRLEIAELESSDRVLREARDDLGMIPADEVVVIEAVPAAGTP